ncbi:MAG: TolC family protein [Phycisphaerae bacterium]
MMTRDVFNAQARNRSLGLVKRIAVAACILTLGGCAQIKPQADFALTRQLFTQSTGLADIYDPDQPLLTPEEIEAVLADGLTLPEALRVALLNNRKLHAEFMSIGVAKADWVQSGLFSNPTFAFSAQFPEGGGRSNIQASFAQNIMELWQIPKRKNAAQAALDETIMRIAHRAAALAVETRSAYLNAVAARELSRIAKENLELATKSHATVTAQREAGAASLLDENLARGQALTADLGVRRTRLDAANAKRHLARLMSVAENVDDIVLSDSMPEGFDVSLQPEALIALARKHRLDLRALAQAARSRAAKVGLEEVNIIPEISIGPFFERGERRGSQGRNLGADFARASIANGAATLPSIQSRSERKAARRQEIDTIFGPAITMTLPIFDQNQAQIAKADFLLQKALKEYEDALIRTAQDIRVALDEMQTALHSATFYHDEVVPQAERNLEFATASYSSGQTNILTLIEAQRLLLEARRGFVAVTLEASTAVARLEQTIGLPLDGLETQESTP